MKNKRLGIGLIVVGVVGLAVLLLIGNRVSNSAIKHFGRVNVGCQVTFTFPSAGTYFVYVEEGKPRQHNNGCEPSTRGDALSVVVSKDGTPVELTPDLSVEYSADGVTGQSRSRFQVEADSRFQVTVTGPDTTPSVAMGIDPDSARRPWRLAAGLIGALGVIGGAVVLAVGRRARLAEREDSSVPEMALAPPSPQGVGDITSPTGIDIRKPKERGTTTVQERADGQSPVKAKSKPPYLPASAVAAVEARRRSSAIPTATQPGPASRDKRPDPEQIANTTESPIVPPRRPPVEGGSKDDRVVDPPKPPKRGVPVVSSGSSRRRPVADSVPPTPTGAPDRARSTQPPSRIPADSRPSENSIGTEKPSRQVSVPAASVTPPVVETVGDVLGDLAGTTPPAGTGRQPDRTDGTAMQRTQRQPLKELPLEGSTRSAARRRSERPVGADRPTSNPVAGRRQPGTNTGPDGGTRRPRRPPVVGDFLDEITVGDVLDDAGEFTDLPPRRRRRRGDEGGVGGGSTGSRGGAQRGSARRDANARDYLYTDDEFEGAEADGFDDYDDVGYAAGTRRRGYRDPGGSRARARSDGRNPSSPRRSARPRPDRGPEPMREWGYERSAADEESFLERETNNTKPVVPPPPPPIRKPPPLPEPDGSDSANGNGPASVEDEWHDAGDDTGAWRWWSPPDPRNRR